MTSRTPIRLTPHRGPLATPSTSPESSPTTSTPPTDISYCSTATRSSLDDSLSQDRISALSLPSRQKSQFRLHRRGHIQSKQRLFGHSRQFNLMFENLTYSIFDFANMLAGIVTFCLLIWGLLEWSSYPSQLSRQPSTQLSAVSHFPLPLRTRAPDSRVNPLVREPNDEHIAVLQFLSEQIQHAKALSSLTISLGLPLRAFFEVHRATILRVVVRQTSPELPHYYREVDLLGNLTKLLDQSLLDFTSGGFIGRSFTLALDELGDLISEPTDLHGNSLAYGEHPDAHLHAIYWRTTSNLLLEYSAARPRAKRVLQHMHTLHQKVLPIVLGQRAVESIARGSGGPQWKDHEMEVFVAGLEVTLCNIRRLIAYLDWITEQLAQTTLTDVLKSHQRTDLSSCLMSLEELSAQSRPSTPKKPCPCLNGHDIRSLSPLEKVDIMVPGSPTVRARY